MKACHEFPEKFKMIHTQTLPLSLFYLIFLVVVCEAFINSKGTYTPNRHDLCNPGKRSVVILSSLLFARIVCSRLG